MSGHITEYIELFDFTPGMYADYHTGFSALSAGHSSVVKDGAATVENTYACCADPSGALVPLPKRNVSKTETAPMPLGSGYSARYPANQNASFVLDAAIQSPARTYLGSLWFDQSQDLDVVTVMHGYIRANPNSTNDYYQIVHGRRYDNLSATSKDIYFLRSNSPQTAGSNASIPKILPVAMVDLGRSDAASSSYPQSADSDVKANLTGMTTFTWASGGTFDYGPGASNSTSDFNSLTTYDSDTNANAQGTGYFPPNSGLWVCPDLASVGGTDESIRTAVDLSNYSRQGMQLVMHQGRAVVLAVDNPALDYNTGRRWLTEMIYASLPYNIHKTSGGGLVELVKTFVEENPTGYGAGASFSANSLLLVKHHGGGVHISGALDSPQVRRLPMLESTYGVVCAPVVTPLGAVYGSRNGVFLWNQGDTAQKLSTQLDGWFWRHERKTSGSYLDQYGGNRGRFGYWHPWVLCPNDFVYDTRTGGWWRLDKMATGDSNQRLEYAPHNVYRVSPSSNQLYAFRYRLTDSSHAEPNNVLWDQYEIDTLATEFSWQSQPLLKSREREITVQEVTLVAQVGQGATGTSVVVTLTGVNEAGTALTPTTITFDLSAAGTSYPVQKIKNAPNYQARYVQVKIVATTSTGPAPKIIGVRLGIGERARSPRS